MTIIDRDLLDRVTSEAKSSPRLRKNFNFHASNEAACHRLLNAVEPGTYIRPHRHNDPAKGEAIVVVRGRLGLLLFDEAGEVTATHLLEAGGEKIGVDLPPASFHSLVSLETGTIFFEAKAGPFVPLIADEIASWAPAEGDAAAAGFRIQMEELVRAGA